MEEMSKADNVETELDIRSPTSPLTQYVRKDFKPIPKTPKPMTSEIRTLKDGSTVEIKLLKDINSDTPRPWTAKVIVVEKGITRDAMKSPSKYQRLVLADSEGTRVQLTLFNRDINMFEDRLELSKHYYISNANVKTITDSRYQITDHPFQWSLHQACVIEEVSEDEKNERVHKYNFVTLGNLWKFKDGTCPIDVLVVIIRLIGIKERNTKNGPVTLQEFIAIDRNMKPIVLTLWDNFVKHEGADLATIIDQKPILACMRVVVNQYDGMSISSKSSSAFLVNPMIPDATNLRSWLFDNMKDVNVLSNKADLVSIARVFGSDITNEISSILNVLQNTQLKLFHVQAKIQLNDYTQKFIYMCCNLCNRSTTALYKQHFTCNSCTKKAISLPRLCVEVLLSDSTGSVNATVFGKDAEKIIGCNAVKVMEQQALEADSQPITSMFNIDNNVKLIVQLKVYHSEYQGKRTRKFIATPLDIASENDVSDDQGSLETIASPQQNCIIGDEDEFNNTSSRIDANADVSKNIKRKLDFLPGDEDDEEEFNLLMKGPNNVKSCENASRNVSKNSKRKLVRPTSNEGILEKMTSPQEKCILEDEDEFDTNTSGNIDEKGVDADTNTSKKSNRKLVLEDE